MRVAAGPLVSGWVSGDHLRMIEPEADVSMAFQENASVVGADRGTTAPEPPPSVPPVDVSRELDVIRVLHGMPGISALAVKNGRIVAQGAAGYRKLGDPAPLLVTDRINIGSCTKWMTAILAGRLVDRGIIKWTSRIRDYFDNFEGFDPSFHDTTLEQLLAHRSGLQKSETFWTSYRPAIMKRTGGKPEIRQWVSETVLGDPPEVKPGEFNYSNQGYAVAARLLEFATGKDWDTLIREEIFEPSRITTGSFSPVYDGELPPKAPVGHDLLAGQNIPEPRPPKDEDFQLRIDATHGPGGGVAFTLQDWAKFLNIMTAADRNGYLKTETALKLQVRHQPDHEYGLGVRVYDRPWASPGPALHHGGSTAGLDSLFWVAPARDLVIVTFANCYAREGTLEEGRASAEALDKVAGLLIKRFGQKAPEGPTLELPLVLSLGKNARRPVFPAGLSLNQMRSVW
jgi:D-alanyl-D-alanine carboxypeptidase